MCNFWNKYAVGIKLEDKEIYFDKVYICQLHNQDRVTEPGLYRFPCTGIYYDYFDGNDWHIDSMVGYLLNDPFVYSNQELPTEWVFEPIVSKSYGTC